MTLGLSLQSSILGRAWRGNSFSKSHAMASEVHAGPRAWRSWLLELGPPPGTPRVLSPGARGLGRRLCSSAPSERVGPAPATVSLRRLAAFRARSLPAHPGLSGAGADGEGVLRGVLGAEDEVGRGDRSCPWAVSSSPGTGSPEFGLSASHDPGGLRWPGHPTGLPHRPRAPLSPGGAGARGRRGAGGDRAEEAKGASRLRFSRAGREGLGRPAGGAGWARVSCPRPSRTSRGS